MNMESVRTEILAYLKIIVTAVIIAYLANHFLFSPYVVKGESMHPNLEEQNKLVVNKLSQFNHLKRFDVIVFNAPDIEDSRYIKRIIGLPGDTVTMTDDILRVNGKVQEEAYLNRNNEKTGLPYTGNFTLAELTGHDKVPDGYVFVLGDNRTVSKDSRYFGLLPKEKIIGKAVYRVWPLRDAGQIE